LLERRQRYRARMRKKVERVTNDEDLL